MFWVVSRYLGRKSRIRESGYWWGVEFFVICVANFIYFLRVNFEIAFFGRLFFLLVVFNFICILELFRGSLL